MLFLQQPGAQPLARFEVKLKNEQQELVIPAKVNLDAITFLPDSVLQLVEIQGKKQDTRFQPGRTFKPKNASLADTCAKQ